MQLTIPQLDGVVNFLYNDNMDISTIDSQSNLVHIFPCSYSYHLQSSQSSSEDYFWYSTSDDEMEDDFVRVSAERRRNDSNGLNGFVIIDPEIAATINSKYARKRLQISHILATYDNPCCTLNCIYEWNPKLIQKLRFSVYQMSMQQQYDYFHDIFENCGILTDLQPIKIMGYKCCMNCLHIVAGFSSKKWNRVVESFSNPMIAVHGNTGRRLQSEEMVKIQSWQYKFFEDFCDLSPDADNGRKLPLYFTWNDVFAQMCYDFELESDNSANWSSKYNLFCRCKNKYFPDVSFHKTTDQGLCEVCISLAIRRTKKMNPQQRLIYEKDREQHNNLFRSERQLYNLRTQRARDNPKEYISIVMDGKNPEYLPNFAQIPKGLCRLRRLKLEVEGLRNHGFRITKFYVYLEHWPHNTNTSMTILHNHISNLLHERKITTGKTLALQVDNCSKELKNTTFFGYAAWLILRGYFQDIYLYQLPPGHTHIDIDQTFKQWSEKKREYSYYSLNDVDLFVKRSYHARNGFSPEVQLLYYTLDWKSFFDGYMADISSFAGFHAFHMFLRDDTVMLLVKDWDSSNNPWQGITANTPIAIMQNCPPGIPNIVSPLPLNEAIINEIYDAITTNNALKPSQEAIQFWHNLTVNSTGYLDLDIIQQLITSSFDSSNYLAPESSISPVIWSTNLLQPLQLQFQQAQQQAMAAIPVTFDAQHPMIVIDDRTNINNMDGFRIAQWIQVDNDRVSIQYYKEDYNTKKWSIDLDYTEETWINVSQVLFTFKFIQNNRLGVRTTNSIARILSRTLPRSGT